MNSIQDQTSVWLRRVAVAAVTCVACASVHAAELISNGDFESPDFTGDAQVTTFTDWTVTSGFAGFGRGDEDDSGRVPGTNPNQVVRMGEVNQGVKSMYQNLSHNWGSSDTYTLSLNATTVWWKTGGTLIVNLLQQDNTVLWTSGTITAPNHPGTAVAAWTPAMTFTYAIDASTFSAGTQGSALRLQINQSANILWLDNVSLDLGGPSATPGTLIYLK